MKKIYYLNNTVAFVTPEEHTVMLLPSSKTAWFTIDTCTLNAEIDTTLRLTNLRRIFETAKYVAFVSPTASESERVFDIFALQFVFVEAGGGMVSSPRGEVLMIYRNGCWDLPKGKLDTGESIEQCALREVQEECGVTELEIERLIIETYHIYEMNDAWVLKRTTWYAMTNEGTEQLTPQTEEGISDIRWIPSPSLDAYVDSSYATIQDVFVAAQNR